MNKNALLLLLLLNWPYWYCLYKWLIIRHLRCRAVAPGCKSLIISDLCQQSVDTSEFIGNSVIDQSNETKLSRLFFNFSSLY